LQIDSRVNHPELVLRQGAERSLRNGHPWVFSGAVEQPPRGVTPGDLVDVVDHRKRFVGRGFFNPRSQIRVRLLTWDPDESVDAPFLQQRISNALALRQQCRVAEYSNARRIIHGENDGLPGLVVDDFAGFAVIQLHTQGMENMRDLLLETLQELLRPAGIFERSDVGTRRAEGMTDRPTGVCLGEEPPRFVEITEGETRLFVDIYSGQKTGFFLDQRDNRLMLQRLCDGKEVLDCFSYSCGYSAHALRGGAQRAVNIDVSAPAFDAGRRNLEHNCPQGSSYQMIRANVFAYLEMLGERGPLFDVVVLDPPSLLRKRGQLKKAMGIYTKLNRNALRIVRDGGLLVSSSCSTHVTPEDFFQVVRRAATGAKVDTRVVAFNLQPADHPVNPAFPEGRYLKAIFARVER
jgi:23S rRNA (cytosine1962-C5)-methyltransferase